MGGGEIWWPLDATREDTRDQLSLHFAHRRDVTNNRSREANEEHVVVACVEAAEVEITDENFAARQFG
jgi:hypothetical protein